MKSFFTLRENTQVTEAVTVPRKDFESLKKGDKVTITFDSSIRKGNTVTYVIKGKSRSAKYNVDKVSMQPEGKPGVQKSFLYSRDGKDATMAQGDMGVTMTKFVKESVEEALKTSDYPKGTSMSAQKFKDSQKKMSKQRALTTKDYPKGTSMSATAWKNKQEEVELDEAPKVPDGMKFLGAYEYKDANGKYHSHRHYSKGGKMNSPVVVYIDDKEWETFQSFTKARKAAINHIKGMKESVEEAKVRGADAYDKTFANRKQADKFAREMGGRVKQVGRVFYVFKEDVDEATILRTKTTRKQSDASKEKDKKKAVKTFQDIRKGKYPGVKIGEATMADKAGPGKGKDMRDMSKLDHAKARDWHQYRVKSKGDYHSKMAKIHHANAIGGSSMLHKEDLDEASIQDIQGILTTIAKSQNMNQAVQMVMKKYKVDQGKAKAMVKKAIDSGVTYDKIKKKYAK